MKIQTKRLIKNTNLQKNPFQAGHKIYIVDSIKMVTGVFRGIDKNDKLFIVVEVDDYK